MRKNLNRLIVSLVVGFIAVALFLVACGAQPATAPPPAPAPTAKPAPAPPKADTAALRAKGEELFQKTAGGMGCQACHGKDGKGQPNIAPDVRGKTADDIKRALGGDAMRSISISESDIAAVAEYLKSLQ